MTGDDRPVTEADVQAAIAEFATAAVIALRYVTGPGAWPGFAAWCEQHVPDEKWDEGDRQDVLALIEIGEALACRLRDAGPPQAGR